MNEDPKQSQRDRYERHIKKLKRQELDKERTPRKPRAKGGGRPPRGHANDDERTFESNSDRRRQRHHAGKRGSKPKETVVGVLTEIHRTRAVLEIDGELRDAFVGPQWTRSEERLAIGDRVTAEERRGVFVIDELLPRETLLSRPDPSQPKRVRVIAANVDIAVIVVSAPSPGAAPKLGLIDRVIIALGQGGVAPLICVNKVDQLTEEPERRALLEALEPYRELGYPALLASAVDGTGIADLSEQLSRRTVVFVGQSGVGKSSLLNRLDPVAARKMGEVRASDKKGKHTTTSSLMHRSADGTAWIDTPGVRAFGLWIDRPALREAFPDLAQLGCRFDDCAHLSEPGCAIPEAIATQRVSAARHASYRRILASLDE